MACLRPFFLLGVICMLLCCGAVFGQVVRLEQSSDDSIIDGTSFKTFQDVGGKLSFLEIQSPAYLQKFKVDGRKTPVGPKGGGTVWMKVDFEQKQQATQPRWLIEFFDGHASEITCYMLYPDGSADSSTAGAGIAFGLRKYLHKNFEYDLDLQKYPKATMYVKARLRGSNLISFKVRSVPHFVWYSLNEYFLLGLYYGMLAIMVIYNLFIYVSVREKLYVYYILYVLCSALLSLMEDGLGFQFIWSEFPSMNVFVEQYSAYMLLITFYFFSRRFLGLRERLPMVNKFLGWLIFGHSVIFFANKVFHFSSYYVFPYPFLIIYASAIVTYYQGNRMARFFLAGFSAAALGIIEQFLRSYNLFHMNVILQVYSFNIGVLAEIVFFSYALADRLRVEKELQNKAQKEVIEQLKENEALKDDLNRKLESRVAQRTNQLADANGRLEDALQKVNAQAVEIRRINMLLNEENTELKSSLTELTKARVLHREVNLSEFTAIFPDVSDCHRFLEQLKWKNGYSCKKCGHGKFCSGKEPLSRRCTRCRYEESITGGTIFHRLKFPITKAFSLLFLVFANKRKITSTELSTILDLRQKTCWGFSRKVEEAWDSWKANPANRDKVLEWENLILEPVSEPELEEAG